MIDLRTKPHDAALELFNNCLMRQYWREDAHAVCMINFHVYDNLEKYMEEVKKEYDKIYREN